MLRRACFAAALIVVSVSAAIAEDNPLQQSNTFSASTWLLSYNWEPGSGTTAITFYDDGTFKTSQGSRGRWVQRGPDDAHALFAFAGGSQPDWSVAYSSTISGDGRSLSGMQGWAHTSGNQQGTHTAIRTAFAEDPTRLQTMIASTGVMAADGSPLDAKASRTKTTRKPAAKSTKKATSTRTSTSSTKTAKKATATASKKPAAKAARGSVSTAKSAAAKSSAAKSSAAKTDAAKTETTKTDAAKTETTKTESAKSESAKSAAVKSAANSPKKPTVKDSTKVVALAR